MITNSEGKNLNISVKAAQLLIELLKTASVSTYLKTCSYSQWLDESTFTTTISLMPIAKVSPRSPPPAPLTNPSVLRLRHRGTSRLVPPPMEHRPRQHLLLRPKHHDLHPLPHHHRLIQPPRPRRRLPRPHYEPPRPLPHHRLLP